MLRRGGLADYQHLSLAESSGDVRARARVAQRFAMQRSTVPDSHIHLRLSFLEVAAGTLRRAPPAQNFAGPIGNLKAHQNTATLVTVVVAWSESVSKRSNYREGLDAIRMQSQTSVLAASPSNELCVRLCIPKDSPAAAILRDERFSLNTKSVNRRK